MQRTYSRAKINTAVPQRMRLCFPDADATLPIAMQQLDLQQLLHNGEHKHCTVICCFTCAFSQSPVYADAQTNAWSTVLLHGVGVTGLWKFCFDGRRCSAIPRQATRGLY